MWLYIGAILLVLIGLAHSYLGERYILMRLLKRGELPQLFGGEAFTKNTLRFAWHITTLAWWGFAAILIHLTEQQVSKAVIGNIIAVTFLIHSLASLIGAKGKHFSWVVFLAIGLAVLFTFHA